MLKKGQKLYSIVNFKCPNCHEGNLYPTKLTDFSRVFTMHHNCPSCGQPYYIEPGFYWGAMYMAYMLSSGIILGGFGVLFFGVGLEILTSFLILIILVGLLYGLIFRLARAIWINIYVHYNPAKKFPPHLKNKTNEHRGS